MSTQNPVLDQDLTSALEEMVVRLRDRAYGQVARELARTLRGDVDVFLDSLARHLLFEEEMLFPALLRQDPAAAKEVRSLLEEHGLLRKLAASLERAIKSGRRTKGRILARQFLAELYTHIDREGRVTDQASEREISSSSAG